MSWERFKQCTLPLSELGFMLDFSRMGHSDKFFDEIRPSMKEAFLAMDALEHGEIANPDENRMVGHYWLRDPSLAPSADIRAEIESTLDGIGNFARGVHEGSHAGANGKFSRLLVIGIGGSALGPQFVERALTNPEQDRLQTLYLDNTDPDEFERVLALLKGMLGNTLVLVISKSGSTPETRNGMLEVAAAYEAAGLVFGDHAVAVTGNGSKLDLLAAEGGWIERFPMWDWVGGRTSETAAVGLLPAALQGFRIDRILAGASAMDAATRSHDLESNPSAILAAMWYYATGGCGDRDMVILPYKDRLSLLSRYLQQLVMESLGKETDIRGKIVNQGIAVYGNKGSTDQHAYVQQLREGVENFFVTFVEVLKDRDGPSLAVEENATSGDFLSGLFLGTRDALSANGRESITITIEEVSPFTVGMLIALFERAVGFYASLIQINAYHQPGVEAGKKAAADLLTLNGEILSALRDSPSTLYTADGLAELINRSGETESVFKILEHLAANSQNRITKSATSGYYDSTYCYTAVSG